VVVYGEQKLKYCLAIFIAMLSCIALSDDRLNGMRVLALSVADNAAVLQLKGSQGVMTYEAGDILFSSYVLIQILPEKIILKYDSDGKSQGDYYWVFKAELGRDSTVQHLSSQEPTVDSPQTSSLSVQLPEESQ